jgi:trk system potassium uptake protein TrkH
VSAQARLALGAAVVLLVVGFFFILAFEWHDSLRGLGLSDKLHNAWFQSVTLRTAGFNSVDITLARSATLILMLIWMFIGGSPGGTAGGVKTTTVSVLALSVVQTIRGQWTLEAFGKRIPERTRAKAAVVVAIAATTALTALVAVLLTQNMPARLALFEVVSALGTVGLSLGGTAELDGIGKAIIIVCMFVGRVGGLTLLMFLSSRRAPPTLGRPEEEIDVG